MFKPKHPLAFLPMSMGFIVLVLSLFLAVIKTADTGPASTQSSRVKAGSGQVSLAISPAKQNFSFKEGSFYPVGLVLSSESEKVKRVDVKIHFDASIVSVDAKLSPGTVLDNVALAQVDNKIGVIIISAENFEPKTASGILMGFRFQPKKAGIVKFTLDDSNVMSTSNQNVLLIVENADYTIDQ